MWFWDREELDAVKDLKERADAYRKQGFIPPGHILTFLGFFAGEDPGLDAAAVTEPAVQPPAVLPPRVHSPELAGEPRFQQVYLQLYLVGSSGRACQQGRTSSGLP